MDIEVGKRRLDLIRHVSDAARGFFFFGAFWCVNVSRDRRPAFTIFLMEWSGVPPWLAAETNHRFIAQLPFRTRRK